MPNHVVNRINLEGDKEKIAEMLNAIKSEDYGIGSIDFNKIIPMPESLNIECGSSTDKGLKAYKEFVDICTFGGANPDMDLLNIPEEKEKIFLRMRTDIKPKEWELGRQAFRNEKMYGATTWYEWSIKNWGTKWNAYGYSEGVNYSEADELYCQTAWSAPHPIINRLSQMYPNIKFTHEWADEDISNNCGRAVYENGMCTSRYFPEPGTKEAYEFSAKIWDMDLNDVGLYLNATETKYIYAEKSDFELIEFMDQKGLFTNERLTAEDIPKGLFVYNLRRSDDGSRFSSVEPKVVVNCGGSVILNKPLDFGGKEFISLTDNTTPNFLGEPDVSLREFLEGRFEQEETENMGEQKL